LTTVMKTERQKNLTTFNFSFQGKHHLWSHAPCLLTLTEIPSLFSKGKMWKLWRGDFIYFNFSQPKRNTKNGEKG